MLNVVLVSEGGEASDSGVAESICEMSTDKLATVSPTINKFQFSQRF